MPLINIVDRALLDDSSDIRMTNDGYMVARPRVARTGIQEYRGSEVGMPSMDTVRVYRPEVEVFNKDSTMTYGHKPITNDHPNKPVTSKNWKDVSVGNVDGEVMRDGEFIRVPMLVMDEKAIQDVKDGKSELSVGYSTELKWEKGVVPGSGEAYDAIQTNIRVNHIAIVDAARGGPKLRVGDAPSPALSQHPAISDADHQEDDEMSDAKTTTVMVDGIALQMGDTAAAIVQKALKDMSDKLNATTAQLTTVTTQAAEAKTAHDAAIAKLTTEGKTALDAATAKVTTLEQQVKDAALTPDKLEAMVKDRGEMLGKAKAVLGDKLVVDKKTDAEIRRQVVDAKLGDSAKGWDDAQVKISFDTLTVGVKADTTTNSSVRDTAHAFSAPTFNAGDAAAKETAYKAKDKKLENRWKGPQAA